LSGGSDNDGYSGYRRSTGTYALCIIDSHNCSEIACCDSSSKEKRNCDRKEIFSMGGV